MPLVAFSSLCCAGPYQKTKDYRAFLHTYERAREWSQKAPALEIACKVALFFPGISSEVLTATITTYHRLGTWEGALEIPRDFYEQALSEFQSVGAIAWRHRYEEVVG